MAFANGCIDSVEQGNWIHSNNATFNATLAEAIKAEYTFTILRCPLRRLVSVFMDKMVAKEPQAWQYRTKLKRQVDLDALTFRSFVNSLADNSLLRFDIHWRPQTDFLLYKNYQDYFCLENFSHAIKTLKERIDFDVMDARNLTNHGLEKHEKIDSQCFADTEAFDLAVLKRNGEIPDYASMYDQELFEVASKLYQADLKLYANKFGPKDLLKKEDIK